MNGLEMYAARLAELLVTVGVDLRHFPRGTLFRVTTADGHVFDMVMLDPAESLMGLRTTHPVFGDTVVATYHGAEKADGTLAVHRIMMNHAMRLSAQRIVLHTREVTDLFLLDQSKGEEFLETAEALTSRQITVRAYLAGVSAQIRGTYREEDAKEILAFLHGWYHPNGVSYVLSLLDLAREAGKFDEAMKVLRYQYKKYWCHQPPEERGTFTDDNLELMEAAYLKLGLPSPFVRNR